MENEKSLGQFPDLGSYFQIMGLCGRIEDALLGNNNLLAIAWKQSLRDKECPRRKILQEIKEVIHDNPMAMIDMFGSDLVNEIRLIPDPDGLP